jgi:hypothetical protein
MSDSARARSKSRARGMKFLNERAFRPRQLRGSKSCRSKSCGSKSCGSKSCGSKSGGARRDRTDDLLLAKQALSQLSYGPVRNQVSVIGNQTTPLITETCCLILRLVGLGRFELPTSRLSSARSNQLSYKPVPGVSDQKPVIRML